MRLGRPSYERDSSPHRRRSRFYSVICMSTALFLDAFVFSLAVSAAGGHPRRIACDFARYCSSLDVFSPTDHARYLTPSQWSENKKVRRQCFRREAAGRQEGLILFTGFEWTRRADPRENYYGHRQCDFQDQDERTCRGAPFSPCRRTSIPTVDNPKMRGARTR